MLQLLQDSKDPNTVALIKQRLHTIIYICIFQTIVFYCLSFFNLLFRQDAGKTKSIVYKVFFNFAIYAVLILLQSVLAGAFLTKDRTPLGYDFFIYANLWNAVLAILLSHILILLQKSRASEIEKLRLKEENKNAQLLALKDQLSPHFFFNTLSSLSNVVRDEHKEHALEFIQEMSNTYRYTLSNREIDLVSLQEEVAFVKSYLFLMKRRLGDKLRCEFEIEEYALQSKVPTMSIQVLLENAVSHNIITNSSPLTIKIFTEKGYVCVENNLKRKEDSESFGIGLENLTNRYRLLAEKEIYIEITDGLFKVKLPLL